MYGIELLCFDSIYSKDILMKMFSNIRFNMNKNISYKMLLIPCSSDSFKPMVETHQSIALAKII